MTWPCTGAFTLPNTDRQRRSPAIVEARATGALVARSEILDAEIELIPVRDTAQPRSVDPAVLAAGFDPSFVRGQSQRSSQTANWS